MARRKATKRIVRTYKQLCRLKRGGDYAQCVKVAGSVYLGPEGLSYRTYSGFVPMATIRQTADGSTLYQVHYGNKRIALSGVSAVLWMRALRKYTPWTQGDPAVPGLGGCVYVVTAPGEWRILTTPAEVPSMWTVPFPQFSVSPRDVLLPSKKSHPYYYARCLRMMRELRKRLAELPESRLHTMVYADPSDPSSVHRLMAVIYHAPTAWNKQALVTRVTTHLMTDTVRERRFRGKPKGWGKSVNAYHVATDSTGLPQSSLWVYRAAAVCDAVAERSLSCVYIPGPG